MSEPESKPPQQAPVVAAADEPKKVSRLNSPWVLWPGTILMALLLYWGLGYLSDGITHESTDDAFIEGHIVSIAPQVAGRIAEVNVIDNQQVKKGDLLVEIDPRDYEAHVAQKKASIRTSEANLKAVLGVLELMTAKVATAEAVAKQAHAQADASKATSERAQADFKRAEPLFKNGTISPQDYDAAVAAARQTEAAFKADEQNAVADDSKIVEAKATWTATEAGVDLARAQVEEAQADIHTTELDLSYAKIYSPCDGRITRKSVEAGGYVEVGQLLLAIVPTEVWVVANFKETQLEEMKSGQTAQILIDAFPDKTLRGHVDSIQSGSGSRFSLLPAENAVGNFVKVVQRVPVKIVFDEVPDPKLGVGPGMSVVPSVHVKNYSIPRLVVLVLAVVLAFLGMAGVKIALARVNHRMKQ